MDKKNEDAIYAKIPSQITVYILFLDTNNAFYHRLMKRGFHHVSIAIQGPVHDDQPDMLIMDTSEKTLSCYWCRRDDWLSKLEAIKQAGEGTYVKVTRYVSVNNSPFLPFKLIAGCSSIGAYAAGLKHLFMTPYGLYTSLVELSKDRLKMKAHGILDISIAGD